MLTSDIGTVIHGTLRSEDLIPKFADTLDHLIKLNDEANAWTIDAEGIESLKQSVEIARNFKDFESDDAFDLVDMLEDNLQNFAPEGAYFGTTEGDGSDFGFWHHLDS